MKTTLLCATLLVAMTISSCEKGDPNPTTPETFPSVQAFLDTREPKAETFLVSAATGGTFTTDKGSTLTIPANAFVDQSGQPVTGNVSVRLKEVFSNSDIMFSGIFPQVQGMVLNSGGEFFLSAANGSVPLRLADGVDLDLSIPAQAVDQGMLLFWGGPEEDVKDPNWELPDSIGGGVGGGGGSFTFNTVDSTYDITLDSMRWGNIDAFMSVNYFNIDFTLTGVSGLNNTNTTAYAVFKNQNSIWPVGTQSWGSITGNVIHETHLADVPMNVVVISVVDGQLYYGLLDVTPAVGQTYSITMKTTTSANLDAVINGLP
jgi:hypothetical protein